MTRERRTPKNIIISHVYSSDNKGDAALTSVLIQDLRQKFSKAAITILKLETAKKGSSFEGVPEKNGFMHYALDQYTNPLFKLGYTLYMFGATLLWATWWRLTGRHMYLPAHLHEIVETYERADLIVAVGGGYLRSRKGLMNRLNVPLLLHPLLFGYILGKPTILYPQSVGPFVNKYEGPVAAFVLKRMTAIILREDTSVTLLARLGVTHNVVRSIDSGFLLPSPRKQNVRKKYHIDDRSLLIGVTVRSWLNGDAQAVYERAVATTLDTIIEKYGAHIIFIPQVTAYKGDDDRIASRRVQNYMQRHAETTLITGEPDHHEIKGIYDALNALLGTRFHSVIFSLTSHVPVLAIEYEHKTSGIMRDLGLDEWVIKIEDVTADKLTSAFEKLLRERDEYTVHLRKKLPPYVRKARQTISLVAQKYESLQG